MKINESVLEECAGLEPAIKFFKKRFEQNQHDENKILATEAFGMRQTGRTTRMLIRAISRCSEGKNVTIYVKTKRIEQFHFEKLEQILAKVPNLGYKITNGFCFIGSNFIAFQVIGNTDVCFDESINDCW